MTLSRIRTITAAHEAAHAVMRKIRGLPATRLTIDDLGNGYCAGTGKRIDAESMLLITLAGPVWELSFVGLDPKLLDLKSTRSDDISEALALLNRCEHLRVRVVEAPGRGLIPLIESSELSLLRWIVRTEKLLLARGTDIKRLSNILAREGALSARRVAGLLRDR